MITIDPSPHPSPIATEQPTPESWVMQIKQRRETRHNVFNVKTKKVKA